MRPFSFASVLLASIGCSTPQPGAPPPADVPATETAADTSAEVSSPDVAIDRGDVTIDAAPEANDPDAAAVEPDAVDASADVVIDPGMCGPRVRRCFCDCAGNGACNNACVAADVDCGGCLYNAATRCCADLARVFEGCVDMSMCRDDPCIARRCASEQRAFESCFAALQMSDDACRREVRACLGPDFPMIQCVR